MAGACRLRGAVQRARCGRVRVRGAAGRRQGRLRQERKEPRKTRGKKRGGGGAARAARGGREHPPERGAALPRNHHVDGDSRVDKVKLFFSQDELMFYDYGKVNACLNISKGAGSCGQEQGARGHGAVSAQEAPRAGKQEGDACSHDPARPRRKSLRKKNTSYWSKHGN